MLLEQAENENVSSLLSEISFNAIKHLFKWLVTNLIVSRKDGAMARKTAIKLMKFH